MGSWAEVDEGQRGLTDMAEKAELSFKTKWTRNSSDFLDISLIISGGKSLCWPFPTGPELSIRSSCGAGLTGPLFSDAQK